MKTIWVNCRDYVYKVSLDGEIHTLRSGSRIDYKKVIALYRAQGYKKVYISFVGYAV